MSTKDSNKTLFIKTQVLIDNPEFLPLFLAFITWSLFTALTHFLIIICRLAGDTLAPVAFILTTVWCYRSRHNFGMGMVKARFDEIDILQLPPRLGAKWDCCEPPTPIEPSAAELKALGIDKIEKSQFAKALTHALDEKAGPAPVSFEQKRQRHYGNMFTNPLEQTKALGQAYNPAATKDEQKGKTENEKDDEEMIIDNVNEIIGQKDEKHQKIADVPPKLNATRSGVEITKT